MRTPGQQDLFADFDPDLPVVEGEAPSSLVAPDLPTDTAAPTLHAVRFRNFKSFAELDLRLGMFNVLAGPNNAGKSTVLQGIDLAYSLTKLLTETDGNSLTKQSRYFPVAMLPVASIRDLFYKQARRVRNQPVEASIHLDFGEGCHIEVGVRQLYGVANCRVVSEKGITPEQLQTINLHRSVWVPSSVGIVRDEEYKTAARLTGLIGAGRTNEVLRNLLLDLHQHQEPRFDQVQRVLDERFGASLGAVEFDGEADQFVRVDYTAASATHDLFSAGSGFLQVLQLLTYVLRRDASVVLLDEPDAHLHSHMQRLVIEVLEDLAGSAGFQVVLATHSKEIINFVDPSRLIFIDHGSTSVGPGVSAGPVAILRALGDIDNVDAFTLFKNRRCLFIEGKGDTAVLSRWARLLGNRAFVGDDSVVAISVGGADRFEHVAQLQVMENLLGAPLQSLELRDRDAMIEETRAERMRGAVRPLHIWQRDSIESYLLDPAVLARLVGELTDGKCAQTASDIEALAMECCDAVRDETVDRVSNRYSMDRARDEARHPTIPEANRVAREAVDAAWPTLESRLTLVSGKRLLGAVRERLQALCGVSFGNERLADAFTAAEVPDEVREALRRVEVLATARP